jgi:hypothetical protein
MKNLFSLMKNTKQLLNQEINQKERQQISPSNKFLGDVEKTE